MKILAPAVLALSLVPPCAAARHQAPAGDVLVVHSAGLHALFPDAKDAGLQRALRMLDERLLELARELGGELPEDPARMVSEVLAQPLCLRVGLAGGAPRAQLTVRCPSAETAARWAGELAGIASALGLESQPVAGGSTLSWAPTPAGRLTYGSDASGGEPLLRIALGPVGEEDFEFAGASGLPDGVEPALYARFDGRSLGGALAMAAMAGPEAAQVVSVLEVLGLVGEHAVPRTFALGFASDRMIAVSRSEGHVAHARRNGLFVEEPLDVADFARVPADATFAHLCQVELAGLVGLFDRVAPGAGDGTCAAVQTETGVDLRELAGAMGPTFGVYASRRTGGGGILSLVAFAEMRDAEACAAGLSRLGRFAQRLAQEHAQGRVALRSWTRDEHPCTSLAFPGLPIPFEPSWAVTDDALLVAACPGALEAALQQLGQPSSLFDHPRLAMVPEESTEGLHGFSFVDTPYCLEQGYGMASLVASALANAVRSPADPGRDPGTVLPSFPELASRAQPWVAWTRVQGGDLVQVAVLDRSWVVNGTALCGSPMVNGYAAGLAGLSIASAVAIPKLMSARVSANESAAIATLRSVAAAQQQMQFGNAIDGDCDGTGEYAFFSEMAGARPLRICGESGTEWGNVEEDLLSPPFLAPAFGALQDDGRGEGVVERQGYYFKIFLPAAPQAGRCAGIGEPLVGSGGAGKLPGAASGERYWCAYAWPVQAGQTGARAYFVNQDGDVLTCERPGTYSGLAAQGGRQPAYDAAYTAADMGSPTATRQPGRDEMRWTAAMARPR